MTSKGITVEGARVPREVGDGNGEGVACTQGHQWSRMPRQGRVQLGAKVCAMPEGFSNLSGFLKA